MSETTETATEATENVKPALTVEILDPLGAMIHAQLVEHSATVAKGQAIIDAANADDARLVVVNMRESHPKYAEVLALTEKVESLISAIDAENLPKVKIPTPDEVTAAQALVESGRESAAPALKYLRDAYGAEYDVSGIVPANLAKRRGRPAGSKNAGAGKRPRLSNAHVTLDGETLATFSHSAEKNEDKATFTNVAKFLSDHGGAKVNVKDLQDHAFTVAGTQDLSTVDGVVEFSVTIGENHYGITVEARQSDK